jgi:hypothetical protein
MNKYLYVGVQWNTTAASYLIILGSKSFTIVSLDLLPIKAYLNKTSSKVHVCNYFSRVFYFESSLTRVSSFITAFQSCFNIHQ